MGQPGAPLIEGFTLVAERGFNSHLIHISPFRKPLNNAHMS